jgi:hypothetical protein
MSFLRRSFQQINFELRERFCEEKSERTQEGRGGEGRGALVFLSTTLHKCMTWCGSLRSKCKKKTTPRSDDSSL